MTTKLSFIYALVHIQKLALFNNLHDVIRKEVPGIV